MASDTTALADEVLVLSLVKDVENVGDAGGRCLQRLAAEALMARTDDAIDATVAAGSRDRLIMIHHRRRIYVLLYHVDNANDENRQNEDRKSSHLVNTVNTFKQVK